MTIVKSVTSVGGASGDPAATYAGEAIDYQIVVSNTGNETLTNVVVTDPTLGTTLASLASLAVGASVTYMAMQTVTQAELDSGNAIPNTAVVTDTQNSVAIVHGHHVRDTESGRVDCEVGDLGGWCVR